MHSNRIIIGSGLQMYVLDWMSSNGIYIIIGADLLVYVLDWMYPTGIIIGAGSWCFTYWTICIFNAILIQSDLLCVCWTNVFQLYDNNKVWSPGVFAFR